jgi:hypothetical protein
MAEEKKEKWLNYLALTTVVFAVCATLSTFKGGGFSTKSVLAQSQASDQWAYFQSKSIKTYLYELQKEKLELESQAGKVPTHLKEEYRKRIDSYSKKIARYDNEKAKIEKDAKGLEGVREEAQRHSQAFGMAVIFLQIAILLSSIAALMKQKLVWIAGLLTGCFGVVHFINGFLLFLG